MLVIHGPPVAPDSNAIDPCLTMTGVAAVMSTSYWSPWRPMMRTKPPPSCTAATTALMSSSTSASSASGMC